MDTLSFSDFLFYPDRVCYWHDKDPNGRQTVPLKTTLPNQGIQLQADKALESALRLVLAITIRNRTGPTGGENALETARFFQAARERDCFDYTVRPPPDNSPDRGSTSIHRRDGSHLLNQLPFGRVYVKQKEDQVAGIWRLSKASIPMEKVRVTVHRRQAEISPNWSEPFDPNELGRWSAVPEPYRRYRSFADRYVDLRRHASDSEARQLHEEIASCIEERLPDDVRLALHELAFGVSLLTGSNETMASSAQRYFNAYVLLAQEPVEKDVIELGRITKDLRRRWSDGQTRNLILPLLTPLVDPKVFADRDFVDEAISRQLRFQGRTWSWYSQLVFETIENAGCPVPQRASVLLKGSEAPPQRDGSPDSKED